jgi:Mrp family chromosome partitioning ATPase
MHSKEQEIWEDAQASQAPETGTAAPKQPETKTDDTGENILPVPVRVRLEPGCVELTHLYAALERYAAGLLQDTAPAFQSVVDSSKDAKQVIGVTSAVAGEGKSTVALHLAINIARNTYKKVCVMDLSLGQNTLYQRLGIDTEQGLIPVLEGKDYTIPTLNLEGTDAPLLMGQGGQEIASLGVSGIDLSLMPAGGVPSNPIRAAHSPALPEIIAAARRIFDIVIVDLPSVSTGYALPLVAQTDGVLMVTAAGVTPRNTVQAALDTVGRDNTLGLVLNRSRVSMPGWLRKRLQPY